MQARDGRESIRVLVKSRTFWIGTFAAALGVVAFASLGFWQWGRGAWKASFLDAYTAALDAEPVPLADALVRLTARDAGDAGIPIPIRTRVYGTYDPARSVLLDNQRRGSEVGVRVFTLFHPADGAPALLVDRGWVPLGPDRRLSDPLDTPITPVLASGLLRPPPSSGIRLGSPPPMDTPDGPPLLTWLDPGELGAAWNLALPPVVLELDPSSPAGFRRDAVPLPNTLPPEQHRGYAVQWWGLAAAVAVIWLVLVWRSRRRDGQSTRGR